MPQKQRNVDKKKVCFTAAAVELEKKVTSYEMFLKYSYVRTSTYEYLLLIDGGAVQKTLGHCCVRKKTNPTTGPTFSNFSDKVEVPRGHENCCRASSREFVRKIGFSDFLWAMQH